MRLRGAVRLALMLCAAAGGMACAGSVETIEAEDDVPPETGGASAGGTSSSGGNDSSGGTPNTGGTTYVEPECPDDPPPPVESECDPLDPFVGCAEGYGCYPYLTYPYGEGCGHATFGAMCAPASTGTQADFCGGSDGYCAPGYMCVVGAAGGRRCGKICPPVAEHGCPDGLICGETDIKGYGVCF